MYFHYNTVKIMKTRTMLHHINKVIRYLRFKLILLWNQIFGEKWENINYKSVPIIINNYNRLSFLKKLIEQLERMGYYNIYILDNKSTYPPLLEFYNTCPYKIFYLKKNFGYLALWKSGIYKIFKNRYFVYTDSDILPGEKCPNNFLDNFYKIMIKYNASKVGFALSINDIPTYYKLRFKVIEHEQKFWKNQINENIFLGDIDTTFALYRPNIKGGCRALGKHIRVGGNYTAYHLPWYIDSENLDNEELFYTNSCIQSTHWSNQLKK